MSVTVTSHVVKRPSRHGVRLNPNRGKNWKKLYSTQPISRHKSRKTPIRLIRIKDEEETNGSTILSAQRCQLKLHRIQHNFYNHIEESDWSTLAFTLAPPLLIERLKKLKITLSTWTTPTDTNGWRRTPASVHTVRDRTAKQHRIVVVTLVFDSRSASPWLDAWRRSRCLWTLFRSGWVTKCKLLLINSMPSRALQWAYS